MSGYDQELVQGILTFIQVFLNEKAATHGGYFEHVAEWLKQKNNENVLLLTYEDMSEDLLREVQRIAHFLKLDVSEEKLRAVVEASSFEV